MRNISKLLLIMLIFYGCSKSSTLNNTLPPNVFDRCPLHGTIQLKSNNRDWLLTNDTVKAEVNLECDRIHKLTIENLQAHSSEQLHISKYIPDTIVIVDNSPRVDIIFDSADNDIHSDNEYFHYINLIYSDVSKIHFNYIKFRLDTTYPQTHLRLSTDSIDWLYENVEKHFKKNEQPHSLRAVTIEHKDFDIKSNPVRKWFYLLLHYWNCYGYRRVWIFYWVLGLLMLFTTLSTCMLSHLNNLHKGVYPIVKISDKKTSSYQAKFLNRVYDAFIWTSCIFFLLKLDVKNINFSKKKICSLFNYCLHSGDSVFSIYGSFCFKAMSR